MKKQSKNSLYAMGSCMGVWLVAICLQDMFNNTGMLLSNIREIPTQDINTIQELEIQINGLKGYLCQNANNCLNWVIYPHLELTLAKPESI